MASSSYYFNQMQSYARCRRDYEGKKSEYESYLQKLKKLNSSLPSIKDDLVTSEKKFLSGGYVDNGETLDRGILKSCYTKLENDISNLNNVISKVEMKIDEFKQKVVEYKNLYNEAQRNYREAKKREAQ